MRIKLFFIIFVLFNLKLLNAQYRKTGEVNRTDRFGVTVMTYFNYANWLPEKHRVKYQFDSFRIWAQSDVSKKVFASIQYLFYPGWRTPFYFYLGWHINDKNTIKMGHVWVPFGFEYQTFDDWGCILYYTGFQLDHDEGLGWQGKYGIFSLYAYYFMNQQLSSSSPQRVDTDIFSGDVGPGNLITVAKRNQEKNQFNLMFEAHPSGNGWDITTGISGMAGQIYNQTTKKYGKRFAGAVHFGINIRKFHFTLQGTTYKFTQQLPDSATQDMKDFINISSFNFAYEMASSASVLTTAAAYDIIGERLTTYVNYSFYSGGTTQANSQSLTAGIRTWWRLFRIFADFHYGVNDPLFSGKATGYGRDAGAYDIGFQMRMYIMLSILKEKTVQRFKNKMAEKD